MTKTRAVLILALIVAAGALAGYGYSYRSGTAPASLSVAPQRIRGRTRDPLLSRSDAARRFWSATPKNDAHGRDYLPVYDDAEPTFDPPPQTAPPQNRRSLGKANARFSYYRNPMGLPDTSPVPKKDSMGMDYIAVYEGDEPSDGNTIKVSLDRVQRSGVRTEPAAGARAGSSGARGRHRRHRRAARRPS